MSDWYYSLVRTLGRHAFFVSAKPVVINLRATARKGAYPLAANHQSAYDVPILIRHSLRHIDFLSITSLFRRKSVAWFFTNMNAFALEQSRPDATTVRIALDRLKRGRVVGWFPEARMRSDETSVIHGGPIRPGICRVAMLARVPILPCVLINTGAYMHAKSWYPLRRTRYAMIFGEALVINPSLEDEAATKDLETRLCAAFRELYSQLAQRCAGQEWFDHPTRYTHR